MKTQSRVVLKNWRYRSSLSLECLLRELAVGDIGYEVQCGRMVVPGDGNNIQFRPT